MGIKKILANHDGVPVKIWTEDVDELSEVQLRNTASMPFVFKHVAAMPDVHYGLGATVGSVLVTKGAIIPAAVGVDIGCGMMAVDTGVDQEMLPDNLNDLYDDILSRVPVGFGQFDENSLLGSHVDAWRSMFKQFDEIDKRHPKAGLFEGKSLPHRQVGTLGGGNHFIEVCVDERGMCWLMLHSGSRGVGNKIGKYFIEQAKELARKWFINLPDQDLAFLPEHTPEFKDYVTAVLWAQNYARLNRECMMNQVIAAFEESVGTCNVTESPIVNCHHNYVAMENHYGKNVWVTRKGAVRARISDMGIIPGSMGARSYIVRGRGCQESFDSCAHGAGRAMSRKEARRRFTHEDLAAQTSGIVCRKDEGVVDEIPAAYKDIDTVMDNQTDLVEVVHELTQVLNVKG